MPRTRKSGEGGLYFDKGKNLWIGVVDNGFYENGKRKQVRVSSRLQSVARTKLDQKKNEIAQYGSPLGNQTVAEWGAFWLETVCKPKMKPQPFRTYRSMLNTWIYPAIGRKNVKDVRPSDLQRLYAQIKSAGHTATAAKVHTVISSMFDAARIERIVSYNVAGDVKAPKALKGERDTFTAEETARILEAARYVPDGTKWMVSLYAGIRQGERMGATLDAIDFSRGLFTVRWNMVEANYEHGCGGTCGRKASGHCPSKRLVIPDGMEYRALKGRYMLVPPKSGEPRTFPLPDSLIRLLEQHVIDLSQRPNPHSLLWPAADGSPVFAAQDQRQWKELLEAAQVKRLNATTHWARHTAISDLTASGSPDRIIGEIVGHKSPGVTGNYQHVSSRDAAAAMDRLGERRQLGV